MSGGAVGAIWAQDRYGVIGADGGMLWRVPADFRHFRAATLGGAVVMGRTTWESIGGALAGRTSIVLTRRPDWAAQDAVVARDLRAGLAAAHDAVDALGEDPREGIYRALPRVWVIGGGSVYAQALDAGFVDRLVISTIDVNAAARADALGLTAEAVTRAPVLGGEWLRDPDRSDPPGSWRPVSGDAAWRVDQWRHI
ncbi:dihydrofolate reductase [Actinomyces succiniciruminis]|uniref:dihydrofolate reductase n=1 Tax=Actinomyces succiniciruminis TaxID=1522002 RepID=A0A1L7RMB9_9ACTO|nr:dihydrofolate reductase [Actinomyces succiniciruminis]CED91340.1 Possible dihydrofolate reductase [Actinomyces succiniciruminis]